MPGMTAATTTPLQTKFGPIVADGAGTITVQEASDVLECSRFRVSELLNASAGRVLVADVLALTSAEQPSALEAVPAAKPVNLPVHADEVLSEGDVARGERLLGAYRNGVAIGSIYNDYGPGTGSTPARPGVRAVR